MHFFISVIDFSAFVIAKYGLHTYVELLTALVNLVILTGIESVLPTCGQFATKELKGVIRTMLFCGQLHEDSMVKFRLIAVRTRLITDGFGSFSQY